MLVSGEGLHDVFRGSEVRIRADQLRDAVPVEFGADSVGDIGEHQSHGGCAEPAVHLPEGCRSGEVDVADRHAVQAEPARRVRCGQERADLLDQPVGVGVEKAGPEPVDHPARQRRGPGGLVPRG